MRSVPSFSRIVKESCERELNQRMWCDKCRRYQLVQNWETVHSIPPVLVMNTGLNKQIEAKQLWSNPGWLPEKIGVIIDKGKLICLEGEALRVSQRNRHAHPMAIYDLIGLVADVNSGEHQKPHMVSLINGEYLHPQAVNPKLTCSSCNILSCTSGEKSMASLQRLSGPQNRYR